MIHYQGRWTVVTGASSGLGRGHAIRLADRGMSLVLTGRNEARLDQVAQETRSLPLPVLTRSKNDSGLLNPYPGFLLRRSNMFIAQDSLNLSRSVRSGM